MRESATFGFGEFELDALRFELRRSGSIVPVQPKVLRLLFHLVANSERSVSRRELLDALWPGEAVTVASVKRAIAGARRALGEHGQSESSIRTVRSHGYRFVGELRTIAAEPAQDAAAHEPAPTAAREPPPAATRPADPPTFGREAALEILDRALAAACAGDTQALLIEGGPGTGKSTTLRELSRRARELGAVVLWARCTNTYVAPPLWPVLQMLREAEDQLDPALLRALTDPSASPMPSTSPALAERKPCPSAQTWQPSEAELFRLSHAFVTLVQHTAERRPVVLACDDIHHADSATLRLLAECAPQLERSRVVVSATMRPLLEPERAVAPHVLKAAAALSQHRVELGDFSPATLARYALQHLPGPRSEATFAALYEWTAGNPRLCDHVFRWLQGGALDRELDLTRCASHSGADALIEQLLAPFPRSTRELLQTAAVLGRDFPLAILAAVAEQRPDEALAQLGDALKLGVVCELPERSPTYRFRAALVREAIYARLPRAERMHRHALAAAALEAQGVADDHVLLASIAAHLARAAPGDDNARAYHYAAQATRVAMRRGAYAEAIQCSDLALQLAPLSNANPEARLALLLEKGDALACLGRIAWARDAASSAARLALELRDADGMVQAAQLLGRLPAPGDEDTTQRNLLEAALSALAPGDARRPFIEALLARAQVWRREPRLRAARATSALAATRGIGDSRERGEALRACLHALADPEFLPQRLAIAEELEVIGREREDRQLLIASAAARVWVYSELGDMPGVDANVRALELLAELTHDPIARWNARAFRAMRAIVAGRLEVAAQHAREALELGTKLSRDLAHRVYCTQMGGILRLEGRLEDAAELVRDVSLRHPAIAGWQAALAGIEAELGRVDHARQVLRRLLDRDMAVLLGDPYGLGALAPAADLCAQVGSAKQAELLYGALLPYADRHGVIAVGANTHGPLARHLGRLALRMGDTARAEQHLARAVAAAERCASPTFLSLSELAYAQLLLRANRRGAREHAAARAARALSLGRDHGLRVVVERARSLAERAKLTLRPIAERAPDRSGAA